MFITVLTGGINNSVENVKMYQNERLASRNLKHIGDDNHYFGRFLCLMVSILA
jgi:hypothetical protein